MKFENKIIVYENGEVEIKVSIDNQNKTIWRRTEDIALLFGAHRPEIVKHIGNIYTSGKLDEKATKFCQWATKVLKQHIRCG